jgi:hypothetical protein
MYIGIAPLQLGVRGDQVVFTAYEHEIKASTDDSVVRYIWLNPQSARHHSWLNVKALLHKLSQCGRSDDELPSETDSSCLKPHRKAN